TCAVLVGSSFVGSVMCTQRLARYFQPHQGPRLSAAIIALYAGSQLIGPWLAKVWIEYGGTLLQSFAVGLGVFVWGLFWTLRTPKAYLYSLISALLIVTEINLYPFSVHKKSKWFCDISSVP